jgi:hypothetical protein
MVISNEPQLTDISRFLIQKGANVNAKNSVKEKFDELLIIIYYNSIYSVYILVTMIIFLNNVFCSTEILLCIRHWTKDFQTLQPY